MDDKMDLRILRSRKMLQRWKQQEHAACPRCGFEMETTIHVIRCKDREANETWDTHLATLRDWMRAQQLHTTATNIICDSLDSWRYSRPLPSIQTSDPTFRHAIQEQDALGWDNMIRGHTSTAWATLFQEAINFTNHRTTGILWMAKVQRKIWEIAWAMWEHRNKQLHVDGQSVHFLDKIAMTAAIHIEWDRGPDGLPPHYNGLFVHHNRPPWSRSLQHQQQWLASVWHARDNHNQQTGERNQRATQFVFRKRSS
jgi:hypothetical protein